MAYVPLIEADMAAGKPARWDSFAKRIHDDFEDHETRLLAEEAVTAALDGRVDLLELGTTSITSTTTGNIDALALGGATFLRMNNATLATIRGIVAPTAGQPKVVVISSIGAGQVNLAHQHATPTAANRLINFVTVGDTPLAAGTGTAILRYDDTTQRWRLVHHEQGAWITQTFDAGDFTGGGSMTVTVAGVDITIHKFLLEGRKLTVTFDIRNLDTGGVAANTIKIALPAAASGGTRFVSANGQIVIGSRSFYNVAGSGVAVGMMGTAVAGTTIDIYRDLNATVWPLSSNDIIIQGQVAFEVQ
jgi:hypothetical protein